jgi:hypothetical protein
VPPAPSALALRATADRQIASIVGAMLPAGTKLVLDPDDSRGLTPEIGHGVMRLGSA